MIFSIKYGICQVDTIYVIREKSFEKIELKISEFENKSHKQDIKNVSLEGKIDANKMLIDEKEKNSDKNFNLIIAFFGLVGVLIGFVIWDRKTSDKPIKKQLDSLKKDVREMKGENQKMKDTLNEINIPE